MSEGWQDRLQQEHDELESRITKLETFVDTPEFRQLPCELRLDLKEQLTYMQSYLGVLCRRLGRPR